MVNLQLHFQSCNLHFGGSKLLGPASGIKRNYVETTAAVVIGGSLNLGVGLGPGIKAYGGTSNTFILPSSKTE